MTMLSEIKEAITVGPTNVGFDVELLIAVNSVGSELSQIGVSQFDELVVIEDTAWPTFDNTLLTNLIKQYMVLKVKQIFDPSASAAISATLDKIAIKLEGRIAHEISQEAE